MGSDELVLLMHQGGIGVLAVYLLQWIKNSKWFPWISQNTGTVNRWAGIVIALATSIGIKIVATGSAGTGYHLGIDIPSLQVLFDTIIHAAVQFGGQQVLYHTTLDPDRPSGGGSGH